MNNNAAKYRIVFEHGRYQPEILYPNGWRFLGGLGASDNIDEVRKKIRRLIETNNETTYVVELLDAEGNPTNG